MLEPRPAARPLASALAASLASALCACASGPSPAPVKDPAIPAKAPVDTAAWTRTYPNGRQAAPPDAQEVRLKDLRRMTFGGQNAEAYWSFGGRELILQSRALGDTCDRIYRFPVPQAAPGLAGLSPALAAPGAPETMRSITDGSGATTCAYFLPGDEEVVWASTHLGGKACPPKPDRSKGYVWALYDTYDVFKSKADGSNVQRLTDAKGYDAEATVCAKDGSIVFTSVRDGDLELYRMDRDGKNVKRLTHSVGYDGGAFFSSDCSKIVWRASRPRPGPELEEYQSLLAQGLVKPSKLDIWVANADGSDQRQITWLDSASFAPFFHPSGKRVIFASNYGDPKHYEFNLFAVDLDGSHLEQVTFAPGFDGFPMFSPDGSLLVFASSRSLPEGSHETDLYLAKWDDAANPVYLPNAPDQVQKDAAFLADPAREGRGPGTKGLAAAADYLEERLKALGLSPAGDWTNPMAKDPVAAFRQKFPVPLTVTVGEKTALGLDGAVVPADLFRPLAGSASGSVKGELVFAGYGIKAPALDRDDYAGLNVKGKLVMVRRFSPTTGKFEATDAQRRYGDLRAKAFTAREAGATGLIVVDWPEAPKGADGQVPADWKLPDEAALPTLFAEGPGDAGLPIVVVKRAAAAAVMDLFEKSLVASKAVLPRGAGKRWVLQPRHASLTVQLTTENVDAYNLVGVLHAGAPEAERLPGVIVLGAHYDHLGFGGKESLEPGSTAPHLGADDNASGVAGVLEAVRLLSEGKASLARDVVVVLFSGEEKGALGSTWFTHHLPAASRIGDLKNIAAMVNLDMVGRMRGNVLNILGGDSAAEWGALLAEPCAAGRLECKIGGDGFGASDQNPFFAAGIPAVHFFTGSHADYHKPSDSADKLSAAGIVQTARVAAAAVLGAGRTPKLTYKSAPAPLPKGDFRNFNASLGVVPDYAGPPAGSRPGVLLSGVRAGGPADKAGLARGDILVQVGAHQILSAADLMFALNASKPGETVTAVVVREGKEVKLPVTFGEGRSR
jgi:hypothetical protein